MMQNRTFWRRGLLAAGLFFGAVVMGWAANLPFFTVTGSGCNEASQLLNCMNQMVNAVNSGVTAQSMAPATNFRNLLDNGAMLVQQRGTGAATAGTTSGCAITSYAADRWCMDVNVTSGAGQLTPITSTPTPPVGFSQALKMVRNSGALTQPQCTWQEIPAADVAPLAGMQIMVSGYVQALAGLAADQGATTQTAQFVIITGTGSDQGLGALRSAVGMTASPAITPAWTGIATLQNTTLALPVTPAWIRYNGAAVAVPTTVTEMAVGVCFTPTAAGQSATDGIAFTGMQLEVLGAGATGPSAYENRPKGVEQTKAQRYFFQVNETNTTEFYSGACTATNVDSIPIPLPVPMDVAPTGTVTAGGFQLVINGAAGTGITGQTFVTNNVAVLSLKATTACTAGQTVVLQGSNTTGIISASADF
jgi:hypothetical protein